MHEMSVFWLRAATFLYSVGLLHAIVSVLRRRSTFFKPALAAFCAGALLHLVSIVELAIATGTLPVHNFFETASLCSLLIGGLFLFIYWRYQFHSLSVFLFPVVFFLALIGGMASPVGPWTSHTVRDAWLLLHVLLVLGGYVALLLTAAASVLYIFQERHLKRKRPHAFFEKLPALGTLDNLITRSMGIGFVLITLAVIAGSTWAFIESGTRWIGEAKIAISFLTWGFYLLMVFLRVSAGWRGRKAAWMSLVVLGCSALTWAAHIDLRSLLIR